MSKVCLTLVLLALAYVVSRAADADKEISDAPTTGIPLKYDPSDESSEDEDEDEEKDDKVNPVEGNEIVIRTVTNHICTIKDTIKMLEEFYEEGKKTPPDTETLMQKILKDAADNGPFYVRTQQAKVFGGTALQKDCFFHVDEDMTKLMFTNYENMERCVNDTKAAYTAALRKLDYKTMRTKGRLLGLTTIRNQCEDPVLDKVTECLAPYLPKFLRSALQVTSGASKAQLTYVKRIARLNDDYKACASQANATLYEKLVPLRTTAEQCVLK